MGHFLNKNFFTTTLVWEDGEVTLWGLYSCMNRLVSNINLENKIIHKLTTYKNVKGLFCIPITIRLTKTIPPGIKYSKKVYISKLDIR